MAEVKYLYSVQVMGKNDIIHYIYIADISRNPKQLIKNAKCVFFFNSLNSSSWRHFQLGTWSLFTLIVVHTKVQK